MWRISKAPRQQPLYSAVVDSSTKVLLALTQNAAVAVFLCEATMDTTHIPGVNYLSKTPFDVAQPAEQYPNWTWNLAQASFVRTRPELVTKQLQGRSKLAVEKAKVIGDIMRQLSIARYPFLAGVLFQETVYLRKQLQAEAFKQAGYPEDSLTDYPYILQYADFASIAPREAADDIIFKSKLDDDLLVKTELLRLKYFNEVKSASDPAELPKIYESFVRESRKNSLV